MRNKDHRILLHFNLGTIWSEVKWKSLSCVQLFATPWTIQSMEFSRPECWSGWPFSSSGDLPNTRIEPKSPVLQVDSLAAEPQGKPLGTMASYNCLYCFPEITTTLKLNDYFHSYRFLHFAMYVCMNRELPDVQAGFRKGRGTRGQIVNIHWIMKKAREFQKNI